MPGAVFLDQRAERRAIRARHTRRLERRAPIRRHEIGDDALVLRRAELLQIEEFNRRRRIRGACELARDARHIARDEALEQRARQRHAVKLVHDRRAHRCRWHEAWRGCPRPDSNGGGCDGGQRRRCPCTGGGPIAQQQVRRDDRHGAADPNRDRLQVPQCAAAPGSRSTLASTSALNVISPTR